MSDTFLRGSTSSPEEVADWLGSDGHDVTCTFGTYNWQDIAIPGVNLLHVMDRGEEGEVYAYDGVSMYARDGVMHVTYTLDGFLIGFDIGHPSDVPGGMLGSVCPHNAVTPLQAEQIVRAVGMDWETAPEGFRQIVENIGEDSETFGYYRLPLPCGVAVCVDDGDSMAWVETNGLSPYFETYDILKVTTSRDSDVCDPSEGGCLWIHTDRCIVGLPIGEVD